MRQMQWTVCLQGEGGVDGETLATFTRPLDGATVADFGLSLEEGRHLLKVLQRAVVQSQIHAYDDARRRCRHCGAYRRIKDWRERVVATTLGEVRVRVPRVVSCLCTPEPLDDDDTPMDRQVFTECPIRRLIPGRRTPELSYLCAKHGASHPYRVAADIVSEITGLRRPCHRTVRRDTLSCGQQLEDAQFIAGWYVGQTQRRGRAQRLRLAIDGTYLTAVPTEDVTKFEVVAGRVEREGGMGRRFACALSRRSMTRTLVAAALEQSGWAPQTEVETFPRHSRNLFAMLLALAFVPSFARAQSNVGEAPPTPSMQVRDVCPDIDQTLPDALWYAWYELGAPAVVTIEFSVKERGIYSITRLSGPKRYFPLVRRAVRNLDCDGRDDQIHRMRLVIRFVQGAAKEVAVIESSSEAVALR